MGSVPYYTGLRLDRMSYRRGDQEWTGSLVRAPDTRVVPIWRDQCLVRAGRPVIVPAVASRDIVEASDQLVLLGIEDGGALFAADLSRSDLSEAQAMAQADEVGDVRTLVPVIEPEQAGLLAYARGILHWHRNQQYCGTCGSRTQSADSGHQRSCLGCGRLLFPRIEPAVIVLVESPGDPRRCLLGRHRGAPPERFSTLAGFVEIGEGLEDAVRREVAEEAGVRVGEVRYQSSQAWPFPAGIMIGFRARALSESFDADDIELDEVRWFTANELSARIADPALGGPYRVDSVGKHLIDDWLAEAG